MAEEKEKTPVELEREANAKERDGIVVTNNVKATEEIVEEKEVEKEVVEEKIEASEEKVDELEEELEDKTLTAAERTKLEKRIQKEREKGKALRDENEALKRQLAAKPVEGEKTYTEEEVRNHAKELANQIVAEDEFKASVSRVAKSCEKIDKDFSEKVVDMVEEVSGTKGAGLPKIMVGILDDLPNNGGHVLMHLADNVETYEELYQLNPVKMALKLKEMSDDLIAKEKKAKTKEISQVPEPKDKLKGKGNTPETRANEKDDMETFVAKRAREAEEYRKRKAGIGYH